MFRLKILLAVAFTIVGAVMCRSQKITHGLQLRDLSSSNSLRIWFDIGEPISYLLTYNHNLLTIKFYTYRKNNNVLIERDYILSDTLQPAYFKALGIFELRDCGEYEGYECFGFDGSMMKVELLDSVSNLKKFQYWSPRDQQKHYLGRLLNSAQDKIESDFQIKYLGGEFYKTLKRGVYWNYGESAIQKK